MIKINANTKITTILKQHPDALEAIISISPKFNKLRNPLLRKLIASRTSIAMASKVGGVSVNDFFGKLQPLGFEVDRSIAEEKNEGQQPVPDYLKNAGQDKITELDVRPVIDSGKDPFSMILQSVRQLEQGGILKLINSFEPAPLIPILGKQGFEAYVEHVSDNLVHTYFYKTGSNIMKEPVKPENSEDWQSKLDRFKDNLITIDVRNLEMPLPMLAILEELDKLPQGKGLFVHHKRIPVFLLPELAERKFEYRIKEVSDGEVYLLIYKE